MIENAHNDVTIAQEVLRRIDADPSLAGCQIEVEAKDGVVVLRGIVASSMAREHAEEDARKVPGVLDVANDIVLTPHGLDDRADGDIAADLRHVLAGDARVPQQAIHLGVTGGVVTLTGQVDHWSEARAAEALAGSIAGVRGVDNQLRVAECVAPRDVHRAIVKALTRHALAEADNLDLSSLGGEVTIAGEVSSLAAKQCLLEAVRQLPGVRNVRSLLRVRSDARRADEVSIV